MNALSLWQLLKQNRLVIQDTPPASPLATPWFVRIMLGFAGWLAAGFLLAFLGIAFEFVFRDEQAGLVVGAMLIAAAYVLFRALPHQEFAAQFGIALSFTGQALMVVSLFGIWQPDEAQPWLILAAIEIALALLLANFLHRVWSAYAAALSLALGLGLTGWYGLIPGLLAGLLLVTVQLSYQRPQRFGLINPLSYGWVLALIHLSEPWFWRRFLYDWLVEQSYPQLPPWVGEALVVAVVLVAVVWLVHRQPEATARQVLMPALLGALVIGLLSFKAPGLAAGTLVILLGYHGGNRSLLGLGILATLFYLASYYYLLELTLLKKSLILMALGAALLALRWLFGRFYPQQQESAHA